MFYWEIKTAEEEWYYQWEIIILKQKQYANISFDQEHIDNFRENVCNNVQFRTKTHHLYFEIVAQW